MLLSLVVAVVVAVGAGASGPVNTRRHTYPLASTEGSQVENQLQTILSTMTENQNQLQSTLQDLMRLTRKTQRDLQNLKEDTDLILGQMYKASCQQIAEDLPENSEAHLTSSEGVYTIRPPKYRPKKVRCELGRGSVGWTVILDRQNGREAFNRSFREYQEGFGQPMQDHWIGLDVLHHLTTWQPHQLRAVMMDWDGQRTWVQYNVFRVAGPDDNYRLTVGQFEADSAAGDGMGIHDQMAFSTYDHDDDDNTDGNCAQIMGGGGGWWYNNCYHVLPTGQYRTSGGNTYGGIAWHPWRNVKHSIKSITLLVKSRD